MAKKKSPVRKLTPIIKKRLKKLPGKSRRYIDPKTKKTYSRRQFEKFHTRAPRKNAKVISDKYKRYLTIRDVFISAKKKEGVIISKREAMASKELQKIIKDLHSKKLEVRKEAFEIVTGGNADEWIPYKERWQGGNL
jgi:vacuolar-type H+-ATPase subunit H